MRRRWPSQLRVTISKQEFFVPVIMLLKAMRESTDAEIYKRVLAGDVSDSFVSDRLEKMLREHAAYVEPLYSRVQCLAFLGNLLRPALRAPARLSDTDLGELFLRRHVFVHLPAEDLSAKFELLVLMLQKLYALGAGRIEPDNPDSLVHQEVLLPGQLWCMITKEKLEDFLRALKLQLERELRPRDAAAALPSASDSKWFTAALQKVGMSNADIGRRLEYFLATGNLVSDSGLDLQQTAGFTIVAERLNYWRRATPPLSRPVARAGRAARATSRLPARWLVCADASAASSPASPTSTPLMPVPPRASRAVQVHLAFPFDPPRRVLHAAAHDHSAQASARCVGLPLPRPHPGRLAMWAAQPPHSRLHGHAVVG